MRKTLVLFVLVSALLSGCTGSKIDCPDEYGPEFEEQYREAIAALEEQGVELRDSDGDCWADIAENQIGTDPESYDSHPTLEEVQGFVENNTVPPTPPAPPMQWSQQEFEGNFQSIPGGASPATGAISTFTVPDNATEVYFNITVTATVPDEFTVRLSDPDNPGFDTPGEVEYGTSSGQGSGHLEGPTPGEWRLSLFSQTLPNQGSFVLVVNSLVPVPVTA